MPEDGGRSLDWQRADLPWEIWLDYSRFTGDVRICDAKVDGVFLLEGSRFEGAVDMERLSVGQDLFLRGGAHFGGEVILGGASVGGQLDASGSRFEGAVDMEILSVGQSLFLRSGAHFGGSIKLVNGKVGETLDASSSTFQGLIDGTGLCVDRELRLATGHDGHLVPVWESKSSLILRNARIGALQDRLEDGKDGWPPKLDLHGCQIGQLGGIRGEGEAANMLRRPVKWWIEWLRRGTAEEYSPQPYRMLAKLFREAGYPSKANAILYAARCRERDEAENLQHRIWLWFLWGSIGFGIGRYFARNVAGWLAALTTVGTAALDFPTNAPLPTEDYLWKIAASLDRLIPFVEMVPRLNLILYDSLSTGQTVYFAIHSLFGWVLAALVVAGLAGLTQKA